MHSTLLPGFSGFFSRTCAPVRAWLPGLLLAGSLAAVASWAAGQAVLRGSGLGALTLAIVLGMVLGNSLYPSWERHCHAGVQLAKQRLLRAGIVLYGLRLTWQDMALVGFAGALVDALMLSSTFFLAWWLGRRMRLEPASCALIGAGSSICGAAAVLAAAPVVRARNDQVAVAVATVVAFGTVAMFLYPALFHWNAAQGWLEASPERYGLYVGSTVHEVAQVVAAGEAIAPQAADVAVIAKMVRVMMLAPFLLLLSWFWTARPGGASRGGSGLVIPWFAFGFLGMIAIHSSGWLPARLVQLGTALDNALLLLAMAALGLGTRFAAMRAAGIRPLLLATCLFAWLLLAGLLLNWLIPALCATLFAPLL